jgi:hypothetical protein
MMGRADDQDGDQHQPHRQWQAECQTLPFPTLSGLLTREWLLGITVPHNDL